jgi:hypothetical protein
MIDQLLTYCARGRWDAEARAGMARVLAEGVDWPALLAAASSHRLAPLLRARLLSVDGDGVPAETRDLLRLAYFASLVRNERLQRDLAEVVAALQAAGVETLVLKGGALAKLYGSLAHRPMVDLDLLIRREAMARAQPVLAELGYLPPAEEVTGPQEFAWYQGGELEFGRVDGQAEPTVLDMHWHLVTVPWFRYASAVDMEAVWAAARPLALDGVTAWQLSAEDMVIHLCLHQAIQHGYQCSLMHYADLDRVVGGGKVCWEELVARASRFRVKTAVYWGLWLARQRLGTEVPDWVLAALAPRGLRQKVLERPILEEQGALGEGVSIGLNRLLRVALIDRPRDLAGMMTRTLFPDREWLRARYELEDGAGTWACRLRHPVGVVSAVARATLQNVEPVGIFYLRK